MRALMTATALSAIFVAPAIAEMWGDSPGCEFASTGVYPSEDFVLVNGQILLFYGGGCDLEYLPRGNAMPMGALCDTDPIEDARLAMSFEQVGSAMIYRDALQHMVTLHACESPLGWETITAGLIEPNPGYVGPAKIDAPANIEAYQILPDGTLVKTR